MRAITSAKLMPAAATSIRTCPLPSGGSGRSCVWNTSGPPCFVISTTRIPCARVSELSEHYRPAPEEPLGGHDLLHNLGRYSGVGRDDHRRQALVLAVGVGGSIG